MSDERQNVQLPLIEYAQQVGWLYLNPREALQQRRGVGGRFLRDTLEAQLLRLNPGVLNAQRVGEVLQRLSQLRTTIEGNRDALAWFHGRMSVYVSEVRRELNVTLIDYEHIENNIFQVTDEWRQKNANGFFTNRADVVFLVNGLPVSLTETKEPSAKDAIAEGVEQIRRYHRQTPDLVTIPQVFEVTHLMDFYYGATWSANRKNLFNWKEEESGNFERKVKHFFDRERFLRVLHDYIIFLTKDDVLTKVILRQHQVGAVEKVLKRVVEDQGHRGLIWHTQGSGKTLTMITIASLLLRTAQDEKPLILMIVDRNELEQQLLKNIDAYGISNYKPIESKKELEDTLNSDYRGLVVSMIHKFGNIEVTNNERKNVVVLIDEAHRSTGSSLGNDLMTALPQATYIGFTGTPIDRISQGKGTFKVFGVQDQRGYLDRYSIAESIEDKTTVQLNYSLAPSHLRVDRETLEKQFLELTEAEGVSDVKELNAILDRAIVLKEIMKADQRIDRIAHFVAEHFTSTIEPMGFKAFLVAVDREACVKYLKALRPLLPDGWVEAVYSSSNDDEGDLKAFALEPRREREIRRDFIRKDKLPKIVIVTEKLLTGYDAPILYGMYLDKPMRDHVLLQAIARVNRPYEDDEGLVKPYGFILDFVGIFEKLERALAFDSDVVKGVIENIDTLEQLFETWMKKDAPKYLSYALGQGAETLEQALIYFAEDKQRRDEFKAFFHRLQNLYNVLSPSPFLGQYQEDYKALALLYVQIQNSIESASIDNELTRKTKELLQASTTSSLLELPGAIHELGPQELARLKQSDLPDTLKLLNLRKLLRVIEQQTPYEPYLKPIGDRAEAVVQQYEERRIETKKALEESLKGAEEYVSAHEARQKLGLDANAFAVYTVLKPSLATITPQQVLTIDQTIRRYPDYQWNEQQERELRAELGVLLYNLYSVVQSEDKAISNAVDLTSNILKLERI